MSRCWSSTATIVGRRTGRRDRAARRRAGTLRRWTCCCCSSRWRARTIMAGAATSWSRATAGSPAAQARPGGAVRLYRHPDPAPAGDRRRARRTVLDEHVLDARDRGGPRLRQVHQGLWFDVGTPVRSRRPRRCSPMAEGRGPQALHDSGASRFADALVAGLMRRGRADWRWRAGWSCSPTTARCGRSPRRSCGRAAAGCCCRGWWRSAAPIWARRPAPRSTADRRRAAAARGRAARRRMILARLVGEERGGGQADRCGGSGAAGGGAGRTLDQLLVEEVAPSGCGDRSGPS